MPAAPVPVVAARAEKSVLAPSSNLSQPAAAEPAVVRRLVSKCQHLAWFGDVMCCVLSCRVLSCCFYLHTLGAPANAFVLKRDKTRVCIL